MGVGLEKRKYGSKYEKYCVILAGNVDCYNAKSCWFSVVLLYWNI